MSTIIYECKFCNYETNRKNNYNRHLSLPKHKIKAGLIQVVDKEPEIFKYPKCQKEFNRKDNLDRHVKTQYVNKNFKCYECNKSYKGEDEFNNHKLLKSHYDKCGENACTLRGTLSGIKKYYAEFIRESIKNMNHGYKNNNYEILLKIKSNLENPIFVNYKDFYKNISVNDYFSFFTEEDKKKWINTSNELGKLYADMHIYEEFNSSEEDNI